MRISHKAIACDLHTHIAHAHIHIDNWLRRNDQNVRDTLKHTLPLTCLEIVLVVVVLDVVHLLEGAHCLTLLLAFVVAVDEHGEGDEGN